jgi:flagellar protein FliL
MSTTATATPAAADAPGPKKNNKKMIILIAVAALVLGGGGGGAYMVMKKKAADAEADADGDAAHAAPKPAVKHDPKAVPTFVPLDPFTVNLADRQAERFAQVGVTLEVADAHMSDQVKAFMPAIRNNILLAIADRSAAELLERDGKTLLAEKIRKETSRALGVEIDEDDDAAEADDAHADKAKAKKTKKKKKKAAAELPVRAVHFSNFIVQ